jgi:hypothetical protein
VPLPALLSYAPYDVIALGNFDFPWWKSSDRHGFPQFDFRHLIPAFDPLDSRAVPAFVVPAFVRGDI